MATVAVLAAAAALIATVDCARAADELQWVRTSVRPNPDELDPPPDITILEGHHGSISVELERLYSWEPRQRRERRKRRW